MAPDRSTEPAAELLELRVLEGPNRFANRPAIKIEFHGDPDAVVGVARAAGEAVREFHRALGLPIPRVTFRRSADRTRAMAAFAWRRRTIAQAIAGAAARVALGGSERRELRALRAVANGQRPVLPVPRIPIVAVTGTNGKSTTTRLIAHIAAQSGMRVGMTNSDGIYIRGELVEAGDWTGFGGAGRILAEPDLDLAVLETARGGILLRGIGYEHNDVSVVTNVSAEHLGLQGIGTLDELAEVKGAVVRITRRGGWAVLNAEDPRVWAMRDHSRARPYAFSLDSAPVVPEALREGGRAAPSVRVVPAAAAPVLWPGGGPARHVRRAVPRCNTPPPPLPPGCSDALACRRPDRGGCRPSPRTNRSIRGA
jgi:cyanophycin synthetase